MLNLQPLVARFLDDLLRTLRRASVNELCEALATETTRAPAARASRGVRSVPVHEASAAEAARPPSRETKKPSRRKAVGRPAAPRQSFIPAGYTTHAAHASHEPHAVGEITEPERLLAVVAEVPAAREPESEGPPSEVEAVEAVEAEAPPESGERTAIAHPPRLRHGEAAVAVKGSTFVIRRAKRA